MPVVRRRKATGLPVVAGSSTEGHAFMPKGTAKHFSGSRSYGFALPEGQGERPLFHRGLVVAGAWRPRGGLR
jgi:hypothetical protein